MSISENFNIFERHQSKWMIGSAIIVAGSIVAVFHSHFGDLVSHPQILGYGAGITALLGVSSYLINKKMHQHTSNTQLKTLMVVIGVTFLAVLALSIVDPAHIGIKDHRNVFGFGVGASVAALLLVGAAISTRQTATDKEIQSLRDLRTQLTWTTSQKQTNRVIQLGKNPKNQCVEAFIKVYKTSNLQKWGPFEELAYLISEKLEFHVVPPTTCIQDTNQRLVVLQKAIHPASTQHHHAGNNLNMINMKSMSRCLLFNLVVGRHDGSKENTVEDQDSHLYEVDNERIGYAKCSSWIFDSFGDQVIDPSAIDNLMRFSERDLEEVFTNFRQKHPKGTIPKNIKLNLQKVKEKLKIPGTHYVRDFKDMTSKVHEQQLEAPFH